MISWRKIANYFKVVFILYKHVTKRNETTFALELNDKLFVGSLLLATKIT